MLKPYQTAHQIIESLPDKRLLKKFKRLVALNVVASFAELVGMALVFPVLSLLLQPEKVKNHHLYTSISNQLDIGFEAFTLLTLFLVILIFFLKNFGLYHLQKSTARFGSNLATHLTEKQVGLIFSLPTEEIEGQKIFKLHQRSRTLPDDFSFNYLDAVFDQLGAWAILITFTVSAAVVSPITVLPLLLIVFPFVLIGGKKLNRVSKILGHKRVSKVPENSKRLHQLFSSILELKLYRASSFFIKGYIKSTREISEIKYQQRFAKGIPPRVFEVLGVTMLFLVFLFHGLFKEDYDGILLNLSVLGILAYKALPKGISIMQQNTNLSNLQSAADNLLEQIRTKTKDADLSENFSFNQSLNFQIDKISFDNGYELNPRISLNLQAGKILGLKGNSGAGKSTIAKAIVGAKSITHGKVILDGKSISHIDEKDTWQQLFAYLGPDTYVFDESIYDNIALSSTYDKQKVDDVLNLSQLSSFIDSKKNLGETGNRLSTGQKQRVAFARALYHNPPILILDEFTSHLDEKNEMAILRIVESIAETRKKAILMISHKSAPLEICFQVVSI